MESVQWWNLLDDGICSMMESAQWLNLLDESA